MKYLRVGIGIALVISALIQLFNRQTWWFIQNVNLIFHEAGHVVFYFFGEFLSILGGSLLEMLVPLLVVVHFVRTQQNFSAAVACWWLATALLSVSIYASDAQERQLPLITNDVSTHDWFNLLSILDLLKYDDLIGYVFFCGSLVAVGGIVFFMSKDKVIASIFTNKV